MDVPRNTEPLLGIGGDNFMGKIDSSYRGSRGASVVIEPIAVRISDAQRVQRPFPLRALPSGRPR